MASYGPIYEFAFDSQNGADILIVISKKSYTGEVTRRPLGRAPILKRDNSGRIYGTSLEIYAECKVDGEYAEFYTSSADEFKVEVWKDQVSIWTGFITPELYSEPDIAPPYDVQIIATDGIGELKNFTFATNGVNSIYGHLRTMLDHAGHSRPLALISNLTYGDDDEQLDPVDFFNMRVDLEHEVEETCYDVLQRLLSSFNAGITLCNDDWVIFRETDFIHMAEDGWVKGVYSNGLSTLFSIVEFGSMSDTDWWPIGQLSSSIEPAKKSLVVEVPNAYKANALSSEWAVSNGASYNESEKAYVLPDEGSYIIQTIDFGEGEVGYRLGLRIRAMNVGGGDKDQSLGVIVKVDGHVAGGYFDYYLLQHDVTDRGTGSYYWDTREGWIEGELAVPTASDTSSDAQDIDIIIPLYDTRKPGVNTRSWIYARSIEITVFNPKGTHDIYVYDVSLVKYEQNEGYQANVNIDNAAREIGDTVTTSLSDASKAPTEGYIFQSGIPLFPKKDSAITTWKIGNSDGKEYLQMMAEDCAMTVALPRMEYRGTLNVSRRTIPFLFRREGTYYFPRTYSYNLINDELEVDLISVPAAEVTATSVVVSQMTQSKGSFSSAGSGGGGGVGSGVDLSGFAKKDEVLKLSELLASMWTLNESGNLVTDKPIVIQNNVVIHGDIASRGAAGGSGGGTSVGVSGIFVNGETLRDDDGDGIIVLPDYEWSAIKGKPTFAKVATSGKYSDLNGLPTIPSLDGYATEEWVEGKNYLTSHQEVVNTGNTLSFGSAIIIGTIGGTQLTAALPSVASVKSTLGLGSLAYKNSLVASDIPALSYLPLSGGTIAGNGAGLFAINRKDGNPVIEFHHNGSVMGRYGFATDGTPIGVVAGSQVTLLHSGNIGEYKAGDSDKLGGVEAAKYFSRIGTIDAVNDDADTLNGFGFYRITSQSGGVGKYPSEYGYMLNFYLPTSKRNGFQLYSSSLGSLYFRRNWETWQSWKAIAFTDSNVASATKLATARTIWGQSFDGTKDINGTLVLNNNANINIKDTGDAPRNALTLDNNNNLRLGYGTSGAGYDALVYGNNLYFHYGTSRTKGLVLNSSGNVTIGGSDTAGTSYKLRVDGTSRFTDRVSVTSLRIIPVNGSYSADFAIDGSSLTLNRELKFTNVTASDICSGIAAAFKTSLAQAESLIARNIILGASSGSASNLALNFQKYASVSNTAPNGLTTLMTLTTDGNLGIGTASPEYRLDVVGKARISDELIVTYPTGFRWAYGDYGVLFRNDANKFYVLLTDAGGALSGSWNALRPLAISLATGDVTMGHNLDVNGTIKSSSVICGTTRVRVNSPTNGGVFGYMDAQLFGTTTNVASVHIGSCYGGSTTLDNTAEYPSGRSMTAISIYRGRVGIGKRWSDTELRALHDANCSLGVWNNAHIMGNLAVSSIYSDNGQSGAAGVFLRNEGGIEITHASTPYIDFHHEAGTTDFSHRLIARASNIFAYSGNYFCPYGSESLGASSYRWKSVYAKAGNFSDDMEINGALTVGGTSTFNGDVRINGNLVVTGDTASGGAGQETTSTSQLLVINQIIPEGTSVSQSALDAIGFTSDVIDDLIDGKYHHVLEVIEGDKSLYTISGYKSTATRVFILQYGSAEADTAWWYVFSQYNGGNWSVTFDEI